MNLSFSHILEIFLSLILPLTVLRKRVRTQKESLCDCQFNDEKKKLTSAENTFFVTINKTVNFKIILKNLK